MFEHGDQDLVEIGVRDAEASLILLIGSEFSARRLHERAFGNGCNQPVPGGLAVAPSADAVHIGLVDAAHRRKRPGGIAVQRRIAHHRLALVARVDEHPSECVREGHQAHHATTRLGVLGGEPRKLSPARLGKHALERLERLENRDGLRAYAEVIGQILGVFDRMLARVRSRKQYAVHALGAERIDRHHGNDGRIDTARKPNDHIGEPGVIGVLPERRYARFVHFLRLHAPAFPRRKLQTAAQPPAVMHPV